MNGELFSNFVVSEEGTPDPRNMQSITENNEKQLIGRNLIGGLFNDNPESKFQINEESKVKQLLASKTPPAQHKNAPNQYQNTRKEKVVMMKHFPHEIGDSSLFATTNFIETTVDGNPLNVEDKSNDHSNDFNTAGSENFLSKQFSSLRMKLDHEMESKTKHELRDTENLKMYRSNTARLHHIPSRPDGTTHHHFEEKATNICKNDMKNKTTLENFVSELDKKESIINEKTTEEQKLKKLSHILGYQIQEGDLVEAQLSHIRSPKLLSAFKSYSMKKTLQRDSVFVPKTENVKTKRNPDRKEMKLLENNQQQSIGHSDIPKAYNTTPLKSSDVTSPTSTKSVLKSAIKSSTNTTPKANSTSNLSLSGAFWKPIVLLGVKSENSIHHSNKSTTETNALIDNSDFKSSQSYLFTKPKRDSSVSSGESNFREITTNKHKPPPLPPKPNKPNSKLNIKVNEYDIAPMSSTKATVEEEGTQQCPSYAGTIIKQEMFQDEALNYCHKKFASTDTIIPEKPRTKFNEMLFAARNKIDLPLNEEVFSPMIVKESSRLKFDISSSPFRPSHENFLSILPIAHVKPKTIYDNTIETQCQNI